MRLDQLPPELLEAIVDLHPDARAQLQLVNHALRAYVRESRSEHSLRVRPAQLNSAWAWLAAQNLTTPAAVQSISLSVTHPGVCAPACLRAGPPRRFDGLAAVTIAGAAVGPGFVEGLPSALQRLELSDYVPREDPATLAEFERLRELRSLSLGGVPGSGVRLSAHFTRLACLDALEVFMELRSCRWGDPGAQDQHAWRFSLAAAGPGGGGGAGGGRAEPWHLPALTSLTIGAFDPLWREDMALVCAQPRLVTLRVWIAKQDWAAEASAQDWAVGVQDWAADRPRRERALAGVAAPQLRELQFCHWDGPWAAAAAHMLAMPRLERLRLTGEFLAERGADAINGVLDTLGGGLPNLKELALETSHFDAVSLRLGALGAFRALRWFGLACGEFTAQDPSLLDGSGAAGLPALTVLCNNSEGIFDDLEAGAPAASPTEAMMERHGHLLDTRVYFRWDFAEEPRLWRYKHYVPEMFRPCGTLGGGLWTAPCTAEQVRMYDLDFVCPYTLREEEGEDGPDAECAKAAGPVRPQPHRGLYMWDLPHELPRRRDLLLREDNLFLRED